MVHSSSKLHPDTKEVEGALIKIEMEHALLSSMSSEPIMCNFSLEVKEQHACSLFEGICLIFLSGLRTANSLQMSGI